MALVAILYPPCPSNQDDPSTEMVTRIAGVACTAGQVMFDDPTTSKALVADAAVAGKHSPAGVVVFSDKAANQAVSLLRKGHLAGFDLAAIAAGSLIYLDTTGTLNTTANGTTTVPVGVVVPTGKINSAGTIDKVIDVFVNPTVKF